MLDHLAGQFRQLSWIVSLVGVLVTTYTLMFANVPTDRFGRPKPPLGRQLLQAGAVVAVGLPGAVWGVVRACRGRQKTPWE